MKQPLHVVQVASLTLGHPNPVLFTPHRQCAIFVFPCHAALPGPVLKSADPDSNPPDFNTDLD